jgi:hypothetical protein
MSRSIGRGAAKFAVQVKSAIRNKEFLFPVD